MISAQASGSTKKTEDFLLSLQKLPIRTIFERAGQDGVNALEAATPKDSGLAAGSWSYEIEQTRTGIAISWYNSDEENGFPVAVALQYGYATGTGGFVPGRDYINPAMRPIFDRIADDLWKAVNSR